MTDSPALLIPSPQGAYRVAPDLGWFNYTDEYKKYGMCVWASRHGVESSIPVAIYSDGYRVFLFPIYTDLASKITSLLGTANDDYIKRVYDATVDDATLYYRLSDLSRDSISPFHFVGICQDLPLEGIEKDAPAGLCTFNWWYYFYNVTLLSETSELAKLLETLDHEGGCVMSSDILYAEAKQEKPNEKLVQAILAEPHKFFMNSFGSPTETRFKHAVIAKVENHDYVDKNPQRTILGFGFRINYNLTNRYAPTAMRKEKFVIMAYREALKRKPDLFACFGMYDPEIVDRDSLDFFYDHTPSMQGLINGTRFHTPTLLRGGSFFGDPARSTDTVVEEILHSLIKDQSLVVTCGIVKDGLRTLFVPVENDTNILALKHQLPADREILYVTDSFDSWVKRK